MGGACSTYGGGRRDGENLKESDPLEDPGLDGRMILRWIFREWDGVIDWIDLARDRDRWRILVKGGNEPSGSIKCGEFLD